jgi:hypothetical protein
MAKISVEQSLELSRILLSTTDATVWAREFWELYGGSVEGYLDEATMISWFAGAIETGRSAGQRPGVSDDRSE